MSCIEHCCAASQIFDDRMAQMQLRKYRRRGPSRTTRRLLAAIRQLPLDNLSLLDVGGGIGPITHELLAAGAPQATLVEASPPSLAAAREESARRGTTNRLKLEEGDLVEVARRLDPADLVTLDKVVCCYPDVDALLTASAALARRFYGIVYPRDAGWTKAVIGMINLWLRWRRIEFRVFAHSNAAIDRTLRSAGLAPRWGHRGPLWLTTLYERR